MHTKVESINSFKKKLFVEIESNDVNQVFADVCIKLQKTAKINGFRTGKVPLSYIKTHFAKKIAIDTAELLIRKFLFKALEANNLAPISMPELTNMNLPQENSNYTFEVSFEILPNIEIPDYNGLEIQVSPLVKVNEDLIQERLNYLQSAQAERKEVSEDIGLESTHDVNIDLNISSPTDTIIPNLQKENVYIDTKDIDLYPTLIQKILNQSIGLKTNEQKTFTLQTNKTEFQSFINFAYSDTQTSNINIDKIENESFEIQVNIKIKTIYEKNLPPLDDNFAKLFNVESLELLKQQIKTKLESYYQDLYEINLHNAALKALSDRISIEIPNSIIEKNINFLIEKHMGQNLSKAELNKIRSNENYRNYFRKEATKISKEHLILMTLIKKENISVTQEEFETWLSSYIENEKVSPINYGKIPDDVKQKLFENLKPEEKEYLKEKLLLKKTFELILKNMKIIEKPIENK